MNLDLGRRQRDTQRGGDLLVSHPVVRAHQDGGAVDLGEPLQRGQNGAELSTEAGLHLRIGVSVRHPFVQCRPPAREPPLVEEQVPRDGEEVRPDRGQIDASTGVPQPDEGLGHDVVGKRGVAGQVQREATDVSGVVSEEPGEVQRWFRVLDPFRSGVGCACLFDVSASDSPIHARGESYSEATASGKAPSRSRGS